MRLGCFKPTRADWDVRFRRLHLFCWNCIQNNTYALFSFNDRLFCISSAPKGGNTVLQQELYGFGNFPKNETRASSLIKIPASYQQQGGQKGQQGGGGQKPGQQQGRSAKWRQSKPRSATACNP